MLITRSFYERPAPPPQKIEPTRDPFPPSGRNGRCAYEMPDIPPQKPTLRQLKKKAKIKMRKETRAKVPKKLSVEERNKKMKKRVPIFDRNNAAPKHARPTKKKSPRKGRKKT